MDFKPFALTRLALTRPVTVCMLFLSLLVFGLFSSQKLPLELLPGIDIPEIYVNVPYPNAAPAEVERLIARPLEEALSTVTGIKVMRSFSREEGVDVGLEFNWEENINTKSIEVRERLDSVRHLLPKDVERVLVFQFNTSDIPIFQLRISSERDLAMAYDLLERQVKRPLERVAGVSKVELYGVAKREVVIRLLPEKLASLQIDAAELVRYLQQQNFAMTAGEIRTKEQSILVKPVGELASMDEIRRLPIKPGIVLADLADIQLELPKLTEGRKLNQSSAVGMNIYKESGANLVQVSKAALAVLKNIDQDPAFQGIDIYVMDDTAESVTDSLSNLLSSGLIGAVLSFAVLFLFLRHMPTTLLVVLSVPVSLVITLGMMYALGYSLNILSMMGLLLAVGMLVDNSVVVIESIFRERTLDTDIRRATERGVYRVGLAVLAGTATTAIVFLPNIIGQKVELTIFLEHVAIAITISLAVSLLIALTLIPLLSQKIKSIGQQQSYQPSRIDQFYRRQLHWTMHHPKAATAIACLLLVSIALPISLVSSGDDEDSDNKKLYINYQLQSNFSLTEVEQEVTRMEDYLLKNKEKFYIESVYSYYNPEEATTTLMLKDGLPMPAKQLQELISKDWPAMVRSKPQFGWDNSGGGLQLYLTGSSTATLLELSDTLLPVLKQIKGLNDVRADISQGQYELQIKLEPDAMQRHGLTAQQVADVVSLALRGTNLRTFRTAEQGEVQLRLLFDKSVGLSLAQLQALPLQLTETGTVRLSQVATLTVTPRLAEIRRFNRQTSLAIGMNLSEELKMDDARKQLEQAIAQLQLPPGYGWSFEGKFRSQDESEGIMATNMLLAVAMIYLVMAALFESLLLPTAVIGSLLFSFVGVFWAFLLTGTTMGVMGMIGMLVLMGVVVNNGIVLVDRINQRRQEDPAAELVGVIMLSCEERLRPILMTVSTTVLGLIPLAIGDANIGGGGPSYAPMAIAIIGGLVFSTLTSLLLVPLTYWGLIRLGGRWQAFVLRSRSRVDRLIRA